MLKNASHRAAAPLGMTVAAYARHRHVSRRAVYDALDAGRIARLPGGRIDPAAADRAWKVNTMPHVGGKMRSMGNAADRRAVETGETEARRLLGAGAGQVLSFNDARRARELVKLSREALALRKLQGETIDVQAARRRVFRFGRVWRDIEDAAVSRKAPLGAAKFNADEGEFYRWLKAFMVEVQTLCANVKLDLLEDVEEEQDEEDGDSEAGEGEHL